MKAQIVLLLAVGLASGHVIPSIKKIVVAPAPVIITQPVSTQYHAQDELGQYTFGYSGGPSAKHETKTADGITSGGYSYIDGNGVVQSAAYLSDPVNGFRVAATNLPVGPAVPTSAKTAVVASAPATVLAKSSVVAAAPIVATAAPIVATVTASPIVAAYPVNLVPKATLVSSTPILAAPVIATAPVLAAAPIIAAGPVITTGGVTGAAKVNSATAYVPRPSPTPAAIVEADNAAVEAAIARSKTAAANAVAANFAAISAANDAAVKAAAANTAAANAAAAKSVAAKAAAINTEYLQAAERVAAAKAASTLVQDTLEVVHAKNSHLAAVEAAKARNAAAAIVAKEQLAQQNAIAHSGPAIVGGSPLLAARTSTVFATSPNVVGKVALASAVPSVVAVTAAPAVVSSITPAVIGPTIVASAVPAITIAKTVPVISAAPAAIAVPALNVVATAAPAIAVATKTAVVSPAAAVVVNPVITTQYHAQDELGQYTFGYSGGPSAKHETKTIDGVTKGGYSYIDAHGHIQNTAYISDPVNGFRVAATNLPVQPGPKYIPDSPEVANAKAKLFKLQAEHIAKL